MKRALGFAAIAALAVFVLAGGAAARPQKRPLLRIFVASGGSVRTSDDRLRCHESCATSYRHGRVLRLTALPDDDFFFDHWEGACIGNAPDCDVALDRNTSARAVFLGKPNPLEVAVGGPGRIVSSAGGIECGDLFFGCRTQLPYASSVTLTPFPSAGGRFGGWVGRCAPVGTAPCTIQVGRGLTEVLAAFGHSSPQPGPQMLTVHAVGSISSDPAGIDCPPTCSAAFPSGTLVVLRSIYPGVWQAPCRSDSRLCALIVDAPTEVFTAGPSGPPPPPPPPPPGRFLVTVSGAGVLTSGNGAIRCGWARAPQTRCAEPIPPRPTVRKLLAKAHRPFRLARWGGVCQGAKPHCTARLRKRSYNGTEFTFSVTALFRRR